MDETNARVLAGTTELNKLSGLISQYDSALYVLIENEEVDVGAQAIGHFYDVSWDPSANVADFCKAVRAKMIAKHGLSHLTGRN